MSYTIDMLELGMNASFTKTITESDVYTFAGVCGDLNPAHINDEYAKNSMFKARIAHGMLCGSLISTVFGMQMPGPGTIFMENNMKFKRPVYFNDTITATVEVSEMLTEKNIVKFTTKCTNQDGVVVIEGTATLMPPKKG
ncbi:MaoC family dehydratase [Mycoplasma sp. P36-A1]|uniref:MaoC family dehydratase n=1 Tax=Mycoplasma sp. P36-A1 TaxID=3252900 RepID=UPI003C2B0EF9